MTAANDAIEMLPVVTDKTINDLLLNNFTYFI